MDLNAHPLLPPPRISENSEVRYGSDLESEPNSAAVKASGVSEADGIPVARAKKKTSAEVCALMRERRAAKIAAAEDPAVAAEQMAEKARHGWEVRAETQRILRSLADEAQALAKSGTGRIPIEKIENVLVAYGMRRMSSFDAEEKLGGVDILLEVYKRRSTVEKPPAQGPHPAGDGGPRSPTAAQVAGSAPVMPSA